jgi:hypothetical protein
MDQWGIITAQLRSISWHFLRHGPKRLIEMARNCLETHPHPPLLDVLWQFHSIFWSKFSIEWGTMFPLSNSSFWSFPYGHPVAADVLFLSFRPFYLSLCFFFYLSIKNMIYRAVPPQDVNNIFSLPFIVSRMSLSSLTLPSLFSLVTRSVQMNFCILLQNHFSKYSFQITPSVHHILNQLNTYCTFTICSSYI